MSARADLVRAAARSVALDLNHGTTGNLSVRTPDGFLVTPTGAALDALREEDLVALDSSGGTAGGGRPSSEWILHHAIYRARPDVNAVLHAHPTHATTLACLRRDIPAVHYLIAMAGGPDVRCAGYAPPGSDHLARLTVAALDGRRACLLAHHGLVALGDDPADALRIALEVETVAGYYWRCLQVGDPPVLSPAEVGELLTRLAAYRKDTEFRV